MSIELEFGEQGPALRGNHRLARRLEDVRAATVALLKLDQSLGRRRVVFRPPGEGGGLPDGHRAAAPVARPRHWRRGRAASFSTADGDLIVCVPPELRTPPIIERLMVEQLLHVGLKVPAAFSIRFLLDGVLGVLHAGEAKPRPRVDIALLSFLASRAEDGEPRSLKPYLSGESGADDLRVYLSVATSFVDFLLAEYGPARLGIFAGNLKPAAPDEASRAAFSKPFHALEKEWRDWAHAEQGRPLSVFGFVAKGLRLYVSQRLASSIALASMVPQLAYTLLMPVGLSVLFNNGILKGDALVIEHTLTWLSIGYFFSALAGLCQDYCSSVAAARAIAGLRERMFRHVQLMPDEVLMQQESGKLTSTFTSDMMLIETVITRVLPNLTFRVILLVGSVMIAFSMEWRMALASVICLPIAFLAPRPLSRIATRASYERKTEDATLAGLVQENVTLSRTIRMFHLQQNRLSVFGRVLKALDRKSERANVYSALAGRLTTVGASFVQLLVIGMGAEFSLDGQVSPGVVIAFIGLLLNMGGAIAVIGDALPLLIQSVGAYQRVDMLLDAPISAEAASAVTPGRWNGVDRSIVFEDVVFNYAGGSPVLDRISFEVTMGEAVAFVGPSGSGKSTVLNLIQRHLDITDGQILLDGTPIGAIAGEDLRRRMATVAQDNPAFNMTVRENIRMGREDATDAEVAAAAQAADLAGDIARMPDGYDTMVGESGGQLSGGQRQRIAIARALLRNPSVLILDEATSALDPAGEKAIDATLAGLRKGRIILAATHRLQQTVDMDKIVVLSQGRIVEVGSHKELLARKGVYAGLWSEQSGLDVSDDGRSAAIALDRLRAVPFFAHLPEDRLGAIARALHSETCAKDEVLLHEGGTPDRFYIVVRGRVALSVTGANGHAVPAGELRPGGCFGEFALLQDMHQLYTATATSDCSFLTLQRAQFIRVFGNEVALREQTEVAIGETLRPELDRLIEGHPEPLPAPARQPEPV